MDSNSIIGKATEELVERAPALERGGDAVSRAVVSVTGRSPLTRELADLLHGPWLGHPVHAVLTDVTIGSWASAMLLDIAGLVTDSDQLEEGADFLTAFGTLSAGATAATGINDYSRIKQDAKREGLLHGLLNMAAFTSYAISTAARIMGKRKVGLGASMLGMGITLYSAWIGGDLVYRKLVGVNHAILPEEGLRNWTRVLRNDELLEAQPKRIEVDGTPILLYRRYGEIYAIGAVCSHAGGPLEQGCFRELTVECPWHQSVFDVRDGSVVHGPATMKEPAFETRVIDGEIEIRAIDD